MGHSNGGIHISNYMSRTHDPRVKGVVFMAPTLDEREYDMRRDGPAKFDAELAEAKAAIDRGEGRTHMIGYLTAQVFWDVENPATRSTHTARIAEYSVPTLSIVGDKDPLFQQGDFLKRFMAAQRPGIARLVMLPGGSHGMRESKDTVVADIDGWIRGTFPR